MRPTENGLVELHDSKERESVCFMLMGFIDDEVDAGGFRHTEKHQELFDERLAQMKAGECAYCDKCPIYARTIEKHPSLKHKVIQLQLFDEL